MLLRIRGIFTPPVFPEGEEKIPQARVLNIPLVSVMIFLAFICSVAIPFILAEILFDSLAVLLFFMITEGHIAYCNVAFSGGDL